MIFTPQNLIYVYFNGLRDRSLIGRLLLKNRKILFQYNPEFLKLGLELSPFKLPLKNDIISSNPEIFNGLFGVFNDSLPDGWGRLLLDRKLTHLGLNPDSLSPLDRLCFVGSQGMGALTYEPEKPHPIITPHHNLDQIDYEIQAFQEQENESFLDDLLALGGSSAGARPKILLKRDNHDWLIKFRSSIEPKDVGCIEYVYHLMARLAGLDVPEAQLFSSQKGPGFFGVKRFDRQDNKHIHMHTISGLLHADHRIPSLDYEMIMKATLHLTKDVRECEKQFRNAVFNVLSHNRDDHSKNFSFLMDEYGTWRVSPAYDLTFSSGPSGEHSTMVMGEGKNPKREHLLKLASIGEVKETKAIEMIEQVLAATSKWCTFAKNYGVSATQTKRIGKALEDIRKNM